MSPELSSQREAVGGRPAIGKVRHSGSPNAYAGIPLERRKNVAPQTLSTTLTGLAQGSKIRRQSRLVLERRGSRVLLGSKARASHLAQIPLCSEISPFRGGHADLEHCAATKTGGQNPRTGRKKWRGGTRALMQFGMAALMSIASLVALVVFFGSTAAAETGKKALILNSTVSGGASRRGGDACNCRRLRRHPRLRRDVGRDDGRPVRRLPADRRGRARQCSSLPAVVSQNATALADAVMATGAGGEHQGW